MASSKPRRIIDSHIHVFPSSELDTLAWLTPNSGHPLDAQHSVEDYISAVKKSKTSSPADVQGFVFLETDRKHDLATKDFNGPLTEVSWVSRIAQGLPRDGEGHTPEHAGLVLGMIPWAPLPLGPEVLAKYVQQAKDAAGASAPLIKGWRYLLQDKAPGTGLTSQFIEGLKWLGREDFVFDVGVDVHREPWQAEEATAMVRAAHDGVKGEKDKITFILNHILKADLTTAQLTSNDLTHTQIFKNWASTIRSLAEFPRVYMKLSGCLMELDAETVWPTDESGKHQVPRAEDLYPVIEPWLSLVLDAFGPERIMFGSDWPVCGANGLGKDAWALWEGIVRIFCDKKMLSEGQRDRIWSGTAAEAYKLSL